MLEAELGKWLVIEPVRVVCGRVVPSIRPFSALILRLKSSEEATSPKPWNCAHETVGAVADIVREVRRMPESSCRKFTGSDITGISIILPACPLKRGLVIAISQAAPS